MRQIEKKSLEEHRDYLYQIVHLKLFWLHRFLMNHPEESFSSAIRNRVDIYRKTDANTELLNPVTLHFDEAPWLTMERAAEECWKQNKTDTAAFEEHAFQIFKPSLDARLVRDYNDRTGTAGYQCGSLRHEWDCSEIEGKKAASFHIANAIAPHSIFENKDYLKQCFQLMLWEVEHLLGAEIITTHTWLNQFPLWLYYFPPEWREHMGKPAENVAWHYGFWGQFITARGTFNKKYGDFVRRTGGTLPHYPCGSWCTIESMRKHLESM